MPIAIIQTKNITIDTIRLIFSTVHGSTRLSCSDASRGGRRVAFARRAFSDPGRGGGGPGGTPGRDVGFTGPTCWGVAICPPAAPDPDGPEGSAGDAVGEPGPEVAVTTTPRQPDRPPTAGSAQHRLSRRPPPGR